MLVASWTTSLPPFPAIQVITSKLISLSVLLELDSKNWTITASRSDCNTLKSPVPYFAPPPECELGLTMDLK